jgi:hypothetical protein
MYALLVPAIVSAVLGAQLVLSLALLKGDICPGQRGRFHHAFWVPAFAWLILVPSSFFAILPFLTLGIFAFRSKTGKTRRSGPIPLLHVANLLGFVTWITLLMAEGGLLVVAGVLQLVLLGASLGHGLLVRARSRLQAFDTLLPLASVMAFMGLIVFVSISVAVTHSDIAPSQINAFIAGAGFGLLAVAAQIWHLVKQVKPTLWRTNTGVLLMFAAVICFNAIVMEQM